MDGGGRDLVAYFTLSAFPVSFFLLSTFNTTLFGNTIAFSMMLAISLLTLLAVKIYTPDIGEEGEGIADFDENLTGHSLLIAFLIGVGTLALAALMLQVPKQSLLYISKPHIPLFAIGPISPQLVGDILYQFTLVSPAEETLKLAGIYALHGRMGETPYSEAFSVSIPVALWATFHSILAGFTPILMIIAFIAGILFYLGQRFTGSLLTPILAHGVFNSTIILLGG